MSRLKFFLQGILNFKEIGTVTRSGPSMCRKMAAGMPKDAQFVIELGSGDGVITNYLLEVLPQDAKLLSFEINPELFKKLAAIKDDRLIAVNDGVENFEKYMDQYGFERLDAVASAIPFIIFPEKKAKSMILAIKAKMKNNAPWMQVHYALSLRNLYEGIFGNFKAHRIYWNLPPAYVFECHNKID